MLSYTIGLVLDFIIGDPNNPFHPVRIIGALGIKLENITRRVFKNLKISGFVTWLGVILITFLVNSLIVRLAFSISNIFGIIIEGILLYFCISFKGLKVEGLKVIKVLESGDIEGARKQLSYIVGRDTEALDEEGIIRAVIETVAENTSDGIIAPLLFGALGGAPLAMTYKAVNTCDSMFGYKNDKYIDFGLVSAKMDDLFNYIPARLTGYLVIFAAFILGLDYKNSYRIYKRDRYNHTSPNSAHPESAVAGALGIRLGGANYYFGKIVEKPTIGDKNKVIEISDLYKTNNILLVVTLLGFSVGLIIIVLGGLL
ncbi:MULTISPECIES: adenosylcobinamide-phosphate synthase CbiB [Clostridium]|uniref:adenosylcobinamide-phosphate synthase CbiB n=1 Tax=Clostridium TaxID=1485 RepID=UPI00066986E0|nr:MULTISPECIES: adenosylcobinamide-phosphate synthase CbiB [Clostridium]MBS7129551.1 cobalamin biosynthesis protein [Clostridium sp.]MDB2075368.1 adenosylcobinamide-phosphate synthase CbiB [Clostridium paraputrificum]MDB2078596.1 adenosylcobinamide-phosphate synthase CbiB [Clostridium paraputrificum]MDB2086835.1 adenosylcobinamide-phosphate synthase CbiB [Clostridium paraputrificum]MDB2098510.1 adenosylcobinamide-phosphate synthase CbiB [Clostridium paraputrificum]